MNYLHYIVKFFNLKWNTTQMYFFEIFMTMKSLHCKMHREPGRILEKYRDLLNICNNSTILWRVDEKPLIIQDHLNSSAIESVWAWPRLNHKNNRWTPSGHYYIIMVFWPTVMLQFVSSTNEILHYYYRFSYDSSLRVCSKKNCEKF